MSSLRIFGISYLATASLFTLAIAYSDHASLSLVTQRAAEALEGQFQDRVLSPVMQFARLQDEKLLDPQVSLPLAEPGPNDARLLAHATVPPMPARTVAPAVAPPPEPTIIMPDLPDSGLPDNGLPDNDQAGTGYGGQAPPPLPKFVQPEARNLPLPPNLPGATSLGPAERASVTAQLAQSLTPEMRNNFDLFLYVSKAKSGPLAQRLYVFKKDSSGALVMAYDWAASTGREQYEISPQGVHARTDTPAGFYQLDPDRMYRAYYSHEWDQSMPYAMFFSWETHGDQTGLAIHAATGDDIAKLGSRASAGCVHISPAHAQLLFEMIRADYRGKAPRFAYDRKTDSMSNKGEMMRDRNGNLVMADGYRVLVDIADFGGADKLAFLN